MPLIRVDRSRQNDEVGVLHRLLGIHHIPVDRAERDCRLEIFDATAHTDDTGGQLFAAQDHAERTADQPDPDNDRPIEWRFHYTSLPTAWAILRMSCINSLNLVGLIDSSPSHSAHSGLEWTSMRIPSAPAATAAFDIGATRFHFPVAWLGSTITGRCDNSFNVGIAARSRVLRYCVSKVRMPRSQSMTLRFPRDMMYSADKRNSLIVAESPRFNNTGLS